MIDPAENLDGQVLDKRYRVERCIARGGMGVVWRALNLESQRSVALKTLGYRTQPSEQVLRRFLHEARATAAVASSNVVRMLDVNLEYIHQGTSLPFIVMELLEGQSFAEYLDAFQRMRPAELVWVMQEVTRGLSLVHDRGIVHRDLKPANLFFARCDDGHIEVKICDFGIAKLQGSVALDLGDLGSLTTETGMLLGTPHFMAPEQFRRTSKEGTETDQWALGQIVFRALTGQNYFGTARNVAELVLAIVHDPLPRPSGISNAFPRELDEWFLRSCSRKANDRFTNVLVQQQELELALGTPDPVAVNFAEAAPSHSTRRGTFTTEVEIPNAAYSSGSSSSGFRRTSGSRARLLLWRLGAVAVAVYGLWLMQGRITKQTQQWSRREPQEGKPSIHERPRVEPSGSMSTTQVSSAENSTWPSPGAPSGTAPVESTPRGPTTSGLKPVARAEAARSGAAKPLLSRGLPCSRSTECADGLCVSEICQ